MQDIRKLFPNDNAFRDAMAQAREALQSVLSDRSMTESAATDDLAVESVSSGGRNARADEAAERIMRGEAAYFSPEAMTYEAIVADAKRPSFYFREDEIIATREGLSPQIKAILAQMDLTFDDIDLFNANKTTLETVAKAAGQIELRDFYFKYAGSAWAIEQDLIVTNRHVAELFLERGLMGEWDFKLDRYGNDPVLCEFDPAQQIDTRRGKVFTIVAVEFVADFGQPDMAFVRLSEKLDVEPVKLSTATAKDGQPIGVVGFPANDPRDNNPMLLKSFFGSKFNVKRFAPGRVTATNDGISSVRYDASTLGGNSGSTVLDLATGDAIALHFAGQANVTNVGVPASVVEKAWRSLSTRAAVSAGTGGAEFATEASRPEMFEGRKGYDPEFLGPDVPIPDVSAYDGNLAKVNQQDGQHELRYMHFSTIQNATRRLPLITAVNIDGTQLRKIPRTDRWQLDGRIADRDQIGNVLYARNPLARGHLVRRLDPCWGDPADVLLAQADTFHYTVAAPQHEDLNQKDWLGLEDYILDSSEDYRFKVSVFTGPIFRDDDKPLKDQPGAQDVAIPREFWKVAVMAKEDGTLSATGYVLSHGPAIASLTEAQFVLGDYRTYQVPLRLIERETQIVFGALKDVDPYDPGETESVIGARIAPIFGPQSLVLNRPRQD